MPEAQTAAGEKRYTSDFYRKQAPDARRSAEIVVPLVMDLIRPESVVDVGCGVGAWLSVFIERGVQDVLGVDGEWMDKAHLMIPGRRFLSFDLEKPLRIDRRFDLAMSVEVAEHLPAPCAETFVESLVRLAPVVLFSAAIPFQGGTHHLNEQWPDYWAGYFRERGYVAVDCLRKKIWRNENVDWWYAQNLLLFAREDYLESRPPLKNEADAAGRPPALVHPRKYLELIDWLESLARTTREIAAAVPPGALFILVDEGAFGNLLAAGRSLPFPEINGEYGGPPPDDASAIREVERLRERGAESIVFTRQAFWWLDHYSELKSYLRRRYRRALANDRLVIFDLQRKDRGDAA
jgi:SAM-dependent methyltransferase